MSVYEQFFKTVFWVSLFIIIYTYVGYAIFTVLLIWLKKIFSRPRVIDHKPLPTLAFIVAAYNEEECIRQKIKNTFRLSYPRNLFQFIIVTDGSTDASPDIVKEFSDILLLHQPLRQGKAAALNRAINNTNAEIVVFSDANTELNENSLMNMVRHYEDPKVGGVAGEKRIRVNDDEAVQEAGEGTYWKYESTLKSLDSQLYSIVGAAGELFSLRRKLFPELPENTILDDFVISLKVCLSGFMVRYEPSAYASELASASIKEEMKRKVRISAGGMQAMVRLGGLFNFFKHPLLTYSYVSHRVLRWTLAPISLLLLLLSNLVIVLGDDPIFYTIFLVVQGLAYFLGLVGWWFANRDIRVPFLYVPFYFLFMNVSVVKGFFVFIRNRHTVLWEKADRNSTEAKKGHEG